MLNAISEQTSAFLTVSLPTKNSIGASLMSFIYFSTIAVIVSLTTNSKINSTTNTKYISKFVRAVDPNYNKTPVFDEFNIQTYEYPFGDMAREVLKLF